MIGKKRNKQERKNGNKERNEKEKKKGVPTEWYII